MIKFDGIKAYRYDYIDEIHFGRAMLSIIREKISVTFLELENCLMCQSPVKIQMNEKTIYMRANVKGIASLKFMINGDKEVEIEDPRLELGFYTDIKNLSLYPDLSLAIRKQLKSDEEGKELEIKSVVLSGIVLVKGYNSLFEDNNSEKAIRW